MWWVSGCYREDHRGGVLESYNTDQRSATPCEAPKLRLCPLRSPEDRGSLAAPSCCFWHTDRKVASLEILVFALEGKIWV